MTIATAPASLFEQQHIVLDEVSWDLYEHLLDGIGDRPIRLTFDDGKLEMMAPLPLHERWKKRIARMIELPALEREVELDTLGSTTFRREDLKKGLEPDECYYIQHAADVRGKGEIDLMVDPPPDLAIEIDITRRSVPRQPIYAAIGVPELWRFEGQRLTILHLGTDGAYHHSATSGVFPFLSMESFESFLLRMELEKQTTVLREFREWVRGLPLSPGKQPG